MADNAISELQQLQKVTAEKQLSAPELHFQVVDGGNRDVSSSETVMDQPAMAGKGFTEKFECKVLSGPGSNIARYKSMSPASLPIVRSPCLTIPPGLSPTALLDSPVLLSNMQQAEPSPTTGTFSLPPIKHDGVGSDNFSSPRDTSSNSAYEDGSSDSFAFKPDVGSYSSSGLPSFRALAPRSSNYQQCPQPVQVQGQHQTQPLASLSAVKTEQLSVSAHELSLSVPAPDPPVYTVTSRAIITAEVASDEPWQRHGSESQTQALQFDQKGPSPLTVVERPSEDGYNWRKYGQKQVKGSEFPRSYYKCTHPNCQMKKHLERSHDGQITEIIYKGSHDHPKPQPSRRLAVGAVLASQDEERSEGLCTSTNAEDKSSNAHAHPSYHIESNGTPELPSVSASDDDVEGAAARSKMGNEVQEDDPESKRRKLEVGVNDATPMSRATREQRVVVQTLSEVDILDDGYRWRKYGQKVVKGNPNPRSYYKCTNAGCPVRKHVERASHDPKAVITTYEGKHNHDVPTTRTSSLEMAGPSIAQNVNTLNDTRTISYYYERSEEKDAISLDLGVGIGQSPENGPNEKQQTTDSEQVPSQVLEIAPISAFCGGLYGDENHFGSREDQGESFSFKNPALNHSSSQYNQNMGRLLMGP